MMEEALLIAIAWMVYAIGYSLSVAGVMFLNRTGPLVVRATDFIVLLFWPVIVPALLASVLYDGANPHKPQPGP
jgi:hypothetical protein